MTSNVFVLLSHPYASYRFEILARANHKMVVIFALDIPETRSCCCKASSHFDISLIG